MNIIFNFIYIKYMYLLNAYEYKKNIHIFFSHSVNNKKLAPLIIDSLMRFKLTENENLRIKWISVALECQSRIEQKLTISRIYKRHFQIENQLLSLIQSLCLYWFY